MNVNQARDLYSAYYEGALDASASKSFEEAMNSDSEIRADFNAFKSVMETLASSANDPVEIPANLHDKVLAKLDHHDWESKRTSKTWFSGWSRLAYGGLAAAALIVAGVGFFQHSNPGYMSGGTSVNENLHAKFTVEADNSLHVEFEKSSFATVNIASLATGSQKTFSLTKGLDQALTNASNDPIIVVISGKGVESIRLAIPGKVKSPKLVGEGDFDDCAKAVASTFAMPVRIDGPNPNSHCQWNLVDSDDGSKIVGGLNRTHISATVADSGLVTIVAK